MVKITEAPSDNQPHNATPDAPSGDQKRGVFRRLLDRVRAWFNRRYQEEESTIDETGSRTSDASLDDQEKGFFGRLWDNVKTWFNKMRSKKDYQAVPTEDPSAADNQPEKGFKKLFNGLKNRLFGKSSIANGKLPNGTHEAPQAVGGQPITNGAPISANNVNPQTRQFESNPQDIQDVVSDIMNEVETVVDGKSQSGVPVAPANGPLPNVTPGAQTVFTTTATVHDAPTASGGQSQNASKNPFDDNIKKDDGNEKTLSASTKVDNLETEHHITKNAKDRGDDTRNCQEPTL
ncbi:hypothetical protein [Wolbachia endosymbiont of Ctenocephalides felis wCfeT]|uniref:hypothetical protein n=1 Tax=Wolbachia endosymbiont of Ctenocephalides felis wCfeT TaxID=2732593 RepID=UPI001446F5CD|nr:hypothetical protein [Wolbachia endosymbiont of Ctenocephalides felis wCfeT]